MAYFRAINTFFNARNMKQTLLFFLFFLMADAVFGQCPTAPLTLSTQAEVDSFKIKYPGCTQLPAALNISGTVENFDSLSVLKKIKGSLTVSFCPQLTDISGLSQLLEIDGSLNFYDNPVLASLGGLDNLQYIGGEFFLQNNAKLADLEGLGSVAFVNGSMTVSDLPVIKNFNGLGSLEYLGKNLLVQNNPKLENFSGLEKLANITTDFKVNQNAVLADFTGLSSLTSIGGVAQIGNNGILSFNGLTSLQTLGGYLFILNNPNLESLNGMPALTNIFGNLFIQNNPVLMSIGALPKVKTIGGSLKISQNLLLESLIGLDSVETIFQDLTVSYSNKIKDFNGLNRLKTVGGNFFIENNGAMTSLSGLENLKSIGQNLKVSTGMLTDISALSVLETVGGNLEITQTSLALLEGWPQLITIGGGVNFNYNTKLEEISGFDGLQDILDGLQINFNSSLKKIEGFSKLAYIGGSLDIWNNQFLNAINGFDSLKMVVNSFGCANNPQLSNISAFKNLKSIGQNFSFSSNYSINSLNFFENLELVGRQISIALNSNLAQCNVLFLCEKLASSPDSVYVSDNAEGCNTGNEIASTCTGIYAFAKGHVFVDFACDSLENGQDVVFPNKILRYMDDFPFATTNFWGDYVKLVKPGINYTFKTPEVLGFLPQPPSRSVQSQIYTDSFPHEDFRLCPDGELTNLCVSIAPSNNPRPGFATNYHICVANVGNTFVPGTLILDIADPYSKGRIDSISYSIAPAGVTGPAVIWNIDTLPPFQSACIDVWIRWKTTLPIGDLVTTQVNISPNGTSDADNSNNIIALRQTSVGSFDPNDKAVNLPAIGLQIAQNRGSLDYQIRFQNTGNFPADFVHVVDTISPLLDTRTIEMLDASHPYILEFPAANVLKWRFENINLPDSTSDEPGSHGYLLFRIKTMPVNFQKDSVFNRCGIYFDYNAPVITNFTKTIISKEIVATSSAENGLFLQAAPNPASEVCLVNFSLETADFCEIKLTDLAGRAVQIFSKRKLEAGNQSVPVDLRGLPGGVYFFDIKTGAKQGAIRIVKH